MLAGLQILAVVGLGEVEPKTDLAAVIGAALKEQGTPLRRDKACEHDLEVRPER